MARKVMNREVCTNKRCNLTGDILFKSQAWCKKHFDEAYNTDDAEYLEGERQRAYFGRSASYNYCEEAPGAIRINDRERRKWVGI